MELVRNFFVLQWTNRLYKAFRAVKLWSFLPLVKSMSMLLVLKVCELLCNKKNVSENANIVKIGVRMSFRQTKI